LKRSGYLGASETGAIVTGSDEYGRNPLSIYLNKLGLKEESESEIMQRGLDLEKTIFDKFLTTTEYTYNWKYQPCNWDDPIQNPDMPWLACHPDAVNDNLKQILEIKIVNNELPIDDRDPVDWLKAIRPSWYWQAQTQLAITGMSKVILFVWVNGSFSWHHQMTVEILPNLDDIKRMLEVTSDFFYTNIQGNKIPESVEEKPIELKTDWVETDPQLIQDIEDFAVMAKQEHDLKQSFDNLKDKLKAVYGEKPYKSILAGQILLRANIKSGASRLSKDRCIANGLDLTGCYERGKPIYTLEVARRKNES